ncbi:MAG: cupin domain-containing protein [Actinomycetota bacterium]
MVHTPSEGPGAASEAAIRAAYAAEGLSPYAWGNGPGYRYGIHTHATHKVLYCVRGSITFTLGGATGDASGTGGTGGAGSVTMHQGDRLDLPAGTAHGAVVGPEGVTCLEAHKRT